MEDREFLEFHRDSYRLLSKNEKASSYLAFVLTGGFIATAGAGVYVALESDKATGLVAAGLGAWGAKALGKLGLESLSSSKIHEALAEGHQADLENLDLFNDEQESTETD